MHAQTVQPHAWVSYLITAAIVGLVLFFRMRRMNRMRPLKLEQLWIVPALYLGVVVMLLAQHPPQGSGWAVVAIGLVVGAAHEPDRSEEHTSELQSLMRISYAVFCLKKKNNIVGQLVN